jgi:Domain of unknown function (DUF4395)
MGVDSAMSASRNFVLQQGLDAPDAAACPVLTSALLFQPRLVGLVLLVAALLQSILLFAVLGAVLCWSALLPRWNPFDALHNRLVADRPQIPRLTPAPPPRRFAQGIAGILAASTAVCLLLGARWTALAIEAVLFLAVAALVFGRFCFGSFLYHISHGRVAFALRTLPWGRGA